MSKDNNKAPKKEEVVEAVEFEQLAADAEVTDEAAEAIAKRNAALMDADIPKYDEADEEVRARMDEYIALIDIENYDTIIEFSRNVFDSIEEISDEVNQKAQDENLFKTSIQDVYAAGQEGDVNDLISTLKNIASNAGSTAANAAKQTASTVAKHPKTAIGTAIGFLLGGFMGAAAGGALGAGTEVLGSKAGKKKGPAADGIIPDDVKELLATANSRLANAHVKIKKLGEEQPEWKELLREQAKRQLETYMELSIVCGAGYEKVKRIRDNELAEANGELQKKPDSKAMQQRVADIARFASELEDHVDDLMMSRASFYEGVVSLREQLQTYERQHRKMLIHTKQGLQQQKAAVARIAHVLKNGETAEVIAFLDKFTQESATASNAAAELLTEFTIKSSRQGVNNSKLLVDQMRTSARNQLRIAKSKIDNAEKKGEDVAAVLDAQRQLSEAAAHNQDVDTKLYLAQGTGDKSGIKQLADESKKKLSDAESVAKKPFGSAAAGRAKPASAAGSQKKPGGPAPK